MSVILSSGIKLSFDSPAKILEWSHSWEIDGDNIVNSLTGSIVGMIIVEGEE